LKIDDQSAGWAAGVVTGPAIHISPNSAKTTKEWPLEHYATLVRKIWTENPEVRVLVSGGKRERELERLKKLSASLEDLRLQLLPQSLSIPQLAGVLTRCRLHIGSDSGVLHLAVALDVPTISFLREQPHYNAFLPAGPRHRVLSMPCSCVDHRDAPCERLNRAECLARIAPSRVADVVREQLATLAHPEQV